MLRFERDERVRILNDPTDRLAGRTGVVARLRMSDNGAWVAMDEDIPDEERSFPADDANGRGNHLLLYPEQCEPA